jgi:DNA mismatch repair protein MutL
MPAPKAAPVPAATEPVQEELPMPKEIPWRMVGELYNTYIIVEQEEDAYLIDKHAAHERYLFEKLKANQEAIASQALLSPVACRMTPDEAAILLTNKSLLQELGFEVEEFGDNTVLVRQVPMDIQAEDAAEVLEGLAADLLNGRREGAKTVRDEILHTVACKAAIKAGWHTDEKELMVLVKIVMERDDLKHCPHGRPICVSLSKKQLEKQFKRS